MLVYFLKTVLIQAIGLGLYFILLRNEKLFSYSRKYLWSVIIASFIIPFIQIPFFEGTEVVQTIHQFPQSIILPEVSITVAPSKSIGLFGIALIVYCLVAITLLLNLFLAYRKIMNIKNRSMHQEPNIYISKEIKLPYSFLKNIYIPKAFAEHESLPMIIVHENAHIQKKHSYDKIAISLLVNLFMFNPLLRVFHRELELIHEYEVDESVIQDYSIDSYLKSLLGSTIYLQNNMNSLTHSFFSSPIKNRIIMLHKKSKNKNFKRVTSITLMLTVILGIVFFQSQKAIAQPSPKINHILTEKDTVFFNNNDGTYTMKYLNKDGQEISSIVETNEFAGLLNKTSNSKGAFSIGDKGEIQLTINTSNEELNTKPESSGDIVRVSSPDGSPTILNLSSGEIEVNENSDFVKPENGAKFPGGNAALIEYMSKNLNYPTEVKEAGMSAKVFVQFKVQTDGSVADVYLLKIETKVNRKAKPNDKLLKKKLEEEALRVINKMPNWEPAYKADGEVVASKMVLPIVFNLPE